MDYNLIAHRPEVEGRCDVCGGELVSRADDSPDALARRLRDYHSKIDPVIELFRGKEYVMSVDARADKFTVQQTIRDRFNLPPFDRSRVGDPLEARS
jgi:adenylate kinase